MLAFVLAFFMILVVLASIISFVVWAIREHLTARKYRHLIRLHEQLKLQAPAHIKGSGPQWEVIYKKRGKRTIEMIGADTEAELMRIVMKTHDIADVEKWRKL